MHQRKDSTHNHGTSEFISKAQQISSHKSMGSTPKLEPTRTWKLWQFHAASQPFCERLVEVIKLFVTPRHLPLLRATRHTEQVPGQEHVWARVTRRQTCECVSARTTPDEGRARDQTPTRSSQRHNGGNITWSHVHSMGATIHRADFRTHNRHEHAGLV